MKGRLSGGLPSLAPCLNQQDMGASSSTPASFITFLMSLSRQLAVQRGQPQRGRAPLPSYGALTRRLAAHSVWAAPSWTLQTTGDLKALTGPGSHCHLRGITQTLDWPPVSRLFGPPPAQQASVQAVPPGGAASVSIECPEGLHVHWGSVKECARRSAFLMAAQQPEPLLENPGDEGLNTLPEPPPHPSGPHYRQPAVCPQGHHHVHGD